MVTYRKCIEKNIQAYCKALDELEAICPDIGIGVNSHPNGALLPRWLKTSYPIKQLIAHADRCDVEWEPLFDRGRPCVIEPDSATWERNFFRVSVRITRPAPCHEWQEAKKGYEGYFDDDENYHPGEPPQPARLVEHYGTVTLCSPTHSWGLKDWFVKADEIRQFLSEAPEPVRAKYLKSYEQAHNEVLQWQRTWQEALARVAMPSFAG